MPFEVHIGACGCSEVDDSVATEVAGVLERESVAIVTLTKCLEKPPETNMQQTADRYGIPDAANPLNA